MHPDDVVIRLVKLPPHVRAATAVDEDGFANVYLDNRLTPDQQRKAFDHELRHIENDDFHNDLPIEVVEALASKPEQAQQLPEPSPTSALPPPCLAPLGAAVSLAVCDQTCDCLGHHADIKARAYVALGILPCDHRLWDQIFDWYMIETMGFDRRKRRFNARNSPTIKRFLVTIFGQEHMDKAAAKLRKEQAILANMRRNEKRRVKRNG